MTDDLAAWLLAQIEDDERVAQAAAPGPWRIDPRDANVIHEAGVGGEWVGVAGSRRDVPGLFTGQTSNRAHQADRDAEHITRWDPARVLAECAAKRAIVESCSTFHCNGDRGLDACVGVVLEHLALPYTDRPGFREEWRP